MRVMTFNLLCAGSGEHEMHKRTGIATETIAQYYPDSFGVQEATSEWMAALCAMLPEYDYVGVAGDDDIDGEFSAVFYLKEKYNVVDSDTFWLSETPDTQSFGWDAACIRICTWAVLENKETGVRYVHMNTHLDHIGVLARENGVNMILEKAASFDIPVVCTGDFNFKESCSLYVTLTGGVLSDSKYLAPDTMSCTTFHAFDPESNADKIIDFVLVNEKVKPEVYHVVTEGIDGKFVSDHYPVYSDFILNAE